MLAKFIQRFCLEETRNVLARYYSDSQFSPFRLKGRLGIVGVPFGKGQKKKGKEEIGLTQAPDMIRNTGFIDILKGLDLDIYDYGNISYKADDCIAYDNMHNLNHVAACIREVTGAVDTVLKGQRACLVLGGDHSIATGSIYGHLCTAGPENVAVIYVDAHADINTNSTTPSGNIHGMTVAMLAEELRRFWPNSEVPGLDWLSPILPLKNIAFIGLRSVDSGEAAFLKDNRVCNYTMEDIGKCGIHNVLNKVLCQIDPRNNKSIHLSFDIDSLDSLEAPCTTAPVRGGLTLREGIDIGETLYRTKRLSVVDLVEVNPAIGTDHQRQITLDSAKHILLSMFGFSRRGNIKR